jgi:hypothetical protein
MHGVHGHVVKDDSNESSFNMAPTYENPSSCEVMYEDDVFASSYVRPTMVIQALWQTAHDMYIQEA